MLELFLPCTLALTLPLGTLRLLRCHSSLHECMTLASVLHVTDSTLSFRSVYFIAFASFVHVVLRYCAQELVSEHTSK